MYSAKDIPIGAENAISRADLAKMWNCSDRVARQRISRMRCEEDNGTLYVIVSHSRHGVHGYYRSDDPRQIRHFIRETEKRARSTFRMIRQARRVLKRIEMQQMHGEGLAG